MCGETLAGIPVDGDAGERPPISGQLDLPPSMPRKDR
jgi:hypothetical protein